MKSMEPQLAIHIETLTIQLKIILGTKKTYIDFLSLSLYLHTHTRTHFLSHLGKIRIKVVVGGGRDHVSGGLVADINFL